MEKKNNENSSITEILEKYKTRLVNVNGKNKSLSLKKLYKKSAFDIMNLAQINDEIGCKVVDFLLNRSKETMKICDDPIAWLNKNIKEVNDEEQREEVIKKEEKIIEYNKIIKNLVKNIKDIEKETGRYELYIGYPFIEGYFKDKTFVKAPLFLFPIEVINKGDKWYIRNLCDLSVLLNKVFIIGYAKFNEEKLCNIETEYEDLSSLGENPIEEIIKRLESEDILINYSDGTLKKFREINQESIIEYNIGQLEIVNNIVLGHFNIANSIYNDYSEMEENALSNNLINELLSIDDIKNEKKNLDIENEEDKNLNVVENDLYFISDLDYSQEVAVIDSQEKDKLVIYGPPGTGKSQTIVNIISQALANSKKILVVSQKKAALDVIYNRGSLINSKMIMFNKDVNRRTFYNNIAMRIDNLCNKPINYKEICSDSTKIQDGIHKLNNINAILFKERKFGLTLQKMYTIPRDIIDNNVTINNFFRELRKDYTFSDITYKEFKRISKDVILNEKAKNYYKLRELYKENLYLSTIKENLNIYEVEDATIELRNLLRGYTKNIDSFVSKFNYYSYAKECIFNKKNINELSNVINELKNKYLLEPINTGSKLTLNYWLNSRKNKVKERENLEVYNEKGKEVEIELSKEVVEIEKFLAKFNFLYEIITKSEVEKIKSNFDKSEEIVGALKSILELLDKYNVIESLRNAENSLTDNELKILSYIYCKENVFDSAKDIIKNIHILAVQCEILVLEKEFADELNIISNYEIIRKDIIDNLKRKKIQVPEFINNKLDNSAYDNKLKNDKQWKEMYRQCCKKNKLLHIREFVSKFEESIFELYPCWLLSPEAVSEVLPLREGLFDYIVFDEASQVFVEAAIPTIYRGKKIIVSGDDKQLRPTSLFNSKYNDDDLEEESLVAALEEESLLDLAKFTFKCTTLNYHYRSKDDELINFSNYAFYGGELQVSPNIDNKVNRKYKSIERIKVFGKWLERKNPIEAMEVVNLIKEILTNRKNEETIGVITFNINQKELIEELIELEVSKDTVFANKYLSELDRYENNEDKGLFIKNIENVQGDERDIIIFSTGYAPNEQGKVIASFGELSKDGGENRLNVAISRAKQKVYVVTSIEPEDLNIDSTKNNGPKFLKKYLQYVRAISEGKYDLSKEILYSLSNNMSTLNIGEYDSDFENQVYDELIKRGLKVERQVGVSGYKINLAIYDDKRTKFILGIECDGYSYEFSNSVRECEIYRRRYLESKGWKIYRLWSRNWWLDKKKELDKIVKIVEEIN